METHVQNILVIDDDPIGRKVISSHLDDAGYTTTTASSMEKAWEILSDSNTNFLAILLDRLMYDRSGVELLNKIKASPAHKHIPVIMVTAHAERQEVIDAVRAGVFDFVYKPVNCDVLLPLVQRAINLYSTH